MIENLAKGIVGGVISGALVAACGYAKNKGQKLNSRELTKTALTGAVVGGIAAYTGVDYFTAEAYLLNIGAITLIQYSIKAVTRRLFNKNNKKAP